MGFFTLALAVVTGVGFGLVPALRASQADLAPSLKSEATAVVGGSGHFRLRKGLVVARVALSLLLLIGAGLFARRLMNLRSLDPGFKPDRLFAFDVDPARNGQDFPQRVATLRRIQEELVGEPGVASASAAGVSRSVLLLVLREVAILAGLGIAIGLPGGYGLGKVIESQLYNLKACDPLTYLVATLALVTTALVAGLIPALRAARVDPMAALRYE